MNDLRFEQLQLGMRAEFEALITEDMVDRFAALSGDTSPLHMDAAFAVSLGQPGRVVHGLLSASLFSTLIGVHLPGKHALFHEIKVGFHKPVHPGTALKVSGEIVYLNEAFRQAEIKGLILGPQGERLVSGMLKVGLTA
jgi:3-hydroxybutyryl-CoA dehydratase